MKSLTAQEIIEKYTEYATIQGQSMLDGNYKMNNKMVKKINVYYKEFQNNTELGKVVLKELLNSDSFQTRINAAADCLRLKLYQDEALRVLRNASKRKDILGFGPEMALEIWKEKGKLDD